MNPPGYSASKAALLSFTRLCRVLLGIAWDSCQCHPPWAVLEYRRCRGSQRSRWTVPFLQRLEGFTCPGRIGHPNKLQARFCFWLPMHQAL